MEGPQKETSTLFFNRSMKSLVESYLDILQDPKFRSWKIIFFLIIHFYFVDRFFFFFFFFFFVLCCVVLFSCFLFFPRKFKGGICCSGHLAITYEGEFLYLRIFL